MNKKGKIDLLSIAIAVIIILLIIYFIKKLIGG